MNSADHEPTSDAEVLARFNKEHSQQAAEHNEKIKQYKETPIEAASAQRPTGTPHFAITISGPFELSLSEQSYTLTAHLYYDPNSGTEPVTVRNGGVPGSGWVDDEIYLFYNADGVALEHEFPDKNIDDDEVPVSAETGFSTIRPGETITQKIKIWLRWWFGLKVGGKYKLLMPHGYIGWWDYGPMEVRSFRQCKLRKV